MLVGSASGGAGSQGPPDGEEWFVLMLAVTGAVLGGGIGFLATAKLPRESDTSRPPGDER
jgi:hypothetical protein